MVILDTRYTQGMSAKQKTNRRDFLAGRSALRAISDLPSLDEAQRAMDARTHSDETSQSASRGYLVQVGRDAMACEFQVLLNAEQDASATEAALAALDLLEPLEDQLTVFRAHSEISQLNRTAAQQWVVVESRLFQLLQQAVDLYQSTGGAFDITAGPLSRTWGFHRRAHRLPCQKEIAAVLATVGTRWLRLDPSRNSVAFARPGLEINLGAIGKGYALDRCAELLVEREVENFVIHGGQSSVLARGSHVGADAVGGWTVSLRHPLRHDQQLAEIHLRDRALGTSGSANQFFHFEGKRYGHVIDPRTGYPADRLLSATVLASSAGQADALATAFFVMGVDQALEYCAGQTDLATILVCSGDRAGSIEIRTHGLSDTDWVRIS